MLLLSPSLGKGEIQIIEQNKNYATENYQEEREVPSPLFVSYCRCQSVAVGMYTALAGTTCL